MVFRLHLDLSGSASLSSRPLNGHGRVVKRGRFGTLRAGTNLVKAKLPGSLGRGAYRLMLDASSKDGTARALVRVQVGSTISGGYLTWSGLKSSKRASTRRKAFAFFVWGVCDAEAL